MKRVVDRVRAGRLSERECAHLGGGEGGRVVAATFKTQAMDGGETRRLVKEEELRIPRSHDGTPPPL